MPVSDAQTLAVCSMSMAHDSNLRRTGEPYREPLRQPAAGQGAGNDRLAELARLIGQDDPFAQMGKRPQAPQGAADPHADAEHAPNWLVRPAQAGAPQPPWRQLLRGAAPEAARRTDDHCGRCGPRGVRHRGGVRLSSLDRPGDHRRAARDQCRAIPDQDRPGPTERRPGEQAGLRPRRRQGRRARGFARGATGRPACRASAHDPRRGRPARPHQCVPTAPRATVPGRPGRARRRQAGHDRYHPGRSAWRHPDTAGPGSAAVARCAGPAGDGPDHDR